MLSSGIEHKKLAASRNPGPTSSSSSDSLDELSDVRMRMDSMTASSGLPGKQPNKKKFISEIEGFAVCLGTLTSPSQVSGGHGKPQEEHFLQPDENFDRQIRDRGRLKVVNQIRLTSKQTGSPGDLDSQLRPTGGTEGGSPHASFDYRLRGRACSEVSLLSLDLGPADARPSQPHQEPDSERKSGDPYL